MGCLICGPKQAAWGIVLSTWGVIMLGLLGIFFHTHSAVLIEDLALEEEDFTDPDPPQRVYQLYNTVGTNCFIAAVVYFLLGACSCCQMRLNKQKAYLVH